MKGQTDFTNPSSIVCLIASDYQALGLEAKANFLVPQLIRIHASLNVVHGFRLRGTNFGLPKHSYKYPQTLRNK